MRFEGIEFRPSRPECQVATTGAWRSDTGHAQERIPETRMSLRAVPSAVLARQHARRLRGVPTVSVLTGPIGLCGREWRGWAVAAARPAVVGAGGLTDWVAAAFAATDPVAHAVRWVAASASRPESEVIREVSDATRYDLDRLRAALPVDPDSPAAAAAFAVLSGDPFPDDLRTVRGLTALLPPECWPALLLTPPDGENDATWVVAAIRRLEPVAVAIPQLPVGVAVSGAAFEALQATASRAAALAREGRVEVHGVTGNELEAQLRVAGVDPPVPPATIERLTAAGLAEEVASAFVAVAKAVRSPTPDDIASDFRSIHEQFLFEQLESMPRTAGLFRPNQYLPFRHGPRPAEADLLAAGLKLVVEIDGGYHHLTPDQYRRDRRKDWLYQRHGYLVLRFLADDVVENLEDILNTILAAADARRPNPTGAA